MLALYEALDHRRSQLKEDTKREVYKRPDVQVRLRCVVRCLQRRLNLLRQLGELQNLELENWNVQDGV